MPIKDWAKEQLLLLWAATANLQSSCACLNSVWAASANYWEDGATAHTTRTGDSWERWKAVCRFWAYQPLSQETGLCWHTSSKTHLAGGGCAGWHHPWASQPVQLKKYLGYQGNRRHLRLVDYALNSPSHQLSDEVVPVLCISAT